MPEPITPYEPMTLRRLGSPLTGGDDSRRWRPVAEFLEEFGPDRARLVLEDVFEAL